jgi:uncharacterized protein YuzE
VSVTYSGRVDAAYIYLVLPKEGVHAAKTVPCDPVETGAEINLDFVSDDRLVGIEVLTASRHLPQAIVDRPSVSDR